MGGHGPCGSYLPIQMGWSTKKYWMMSWCGPGWIRRVNRTWTGPFASLDWYFWIDPDNSSQLHVSLLDSVPDTRSPDMTGLAHTRFDIHPCVDWMAVYAQNEQLQVYTRNDTKTEFCFLRVPDCANRHVQSLNLLDVHASHAVVTLSNKFCFIFSTALARLLPYFGASGYHSGIAYASWPDVWIYISNFGSLGWWHSLEHFPLSMSRFSSRHKTWLPHQLHVYEPFAHLHATVCSHSTFTPWDRLAPAIFASARNFVWVSAPTTWPTSKSRFSIFFFQSFTSGFVCNCLRFHYVTPTTPLLRLRPTQAHCSSWWLLELRFNFTNTRWQVG